MKKRNMKKQNMDRKRDAALKRDNALKRNDALKHNATLKRDAALKRRRFWKKWAAAAAAVLFIILMVCGDQAHAAGTEKNASAWAAGKGVLAQAGGGDVLVQAAGGDDLAQPGKEDGDMLPLLTGGDDFDALQEVIDAASGEYSVSFSDIVAQLFSGDVEMTLESVGRYIYEHIFLEITANRTALLQIIGIALLGAVFTNFSVAFAKNHVAATGFYITYLILFSLLLTAFMAAFNVASGMLEFLVDFMSALLPAFCTAIAFAAGSASASGFYAVMAMAVTVVDWLICHLLLAAIQVYMLLSLADHMSKDQYLSRMCELIRTLICWALKTMLGLTLGLNVIQGLILPAFDSFKSSAFMKLSSVIPGIGNAINAAARTAIGSGVLIKNAIGVGGLVVILIICALPLVKLLIITLMYKAAGAVIEPVSDPRIVECLQMTADSVLLLLMAVGTAVLLFVLSLAVIASSSNLSIGGG